MWIGPISIDYVGLYVVVLSPLTLGVFYLKPGARTFKFGLGLETGFKPVFLDQMVNFDVTTDLTISLCQTENAASHWLLEIRSSQQNGGAFSKFKFSDSQR